MFLVVRPDMTTWKDFLITTTLVFNNSYQVFSEFVSNEMYSEFLGTNENIILIL